MKDLLLDSDLLLPDGAAIRTMYRVGIAYKKRDGPNLHNLNGTDFLPFFLDYLHKSEYKVNLITLTVYDEKHNNPEGYLKDGVNKYIQERRTHFRQHNEEIEYNDTNYNDFDRDGIKKFLQQDLNSQEPTINIFLNFRGGGGR